ncbi:MAG: sialate O-acetylesterase [Limisphaerales bacterium]
MQSQFSGNAHRNPQFFKAVSSALAGGFVAFLLLASITTKADVSVPHVFGNNMVLQREMPVRVWGQANAGEKVIVRISGREVSTVTDKTGKWSVKLSPMKASNGPLTMTITGANTITFTNVAVGEVWLCSGQSNMGFGMNQVNDAKQEISEANFPQIRLLSIPQTNSGQPKLDTDAQWAVCSPRTLGAGRAGFTAVGYYFGRELHRELGVPIGLIKSAWGGTRIEPWTAPEGFASDPQYKDITKQIKETSTNNLNATNKAKRGRPPASIYNAMIHPLVGYGMRGVIWYQGEANRSDGAAYTDRMKALIGGWRKIWKEGDFPFYYAQIAPFRYPGNTELTMSLWEAQMRAMAIPNTGMAVTTDLVTDIQSIHPKNKKDVGQRLARWALAKTYGRKDVIFSGPIYRKMKIEGDKIRLRFQYADGGLKSRDGKELTWFEIAGADGNFVKAVAEIAGPDSLVVRSSDVKQPTDVRFGWNQEAMPNLVNGAGLPASPFRTGR